MLSVRNTSGLSKFIMIMFVLIFVVALVVIGCFIYYGRLAAKKYLETHEESVSDDTVSDPIGIKFGYKFCSF